MFTTVLTTAVRQSVIFIAVGTPQERTVPPISSTCSPSPATSARAMNGYKVIVNKSTVPVGTAERVRDLIRRETTHPFSVVSNPEFLKQGAAIDDFMKPDRVVIGAEDCRAAEIMRELYAPVHTRPGRPIMVMDCASAELSKYAANAHARHPHLVHERSGERLRGCSARTSTRCGRPSGRDRRIGSSFLFPGVGYGGSCFPKDVKAILKFAADKGYDFEMLGPSRTVNQRQKGRLVAKMETHFGSLSGQDDRALGAGVQAAHR